MRIVMEESGWRVLSPARPDEMICLRRLVLQCGYRICEVCRELGCSERYLYEVAKRDVGLPPKAWMRQERMVTAKRMLGEGMGFSEVAEKLGFASTAGFRREFREIYGILPREYVRGLEEGDTK